MSTTKDSGAQSNPEPESGMNGDSISTNHTSLPLPIALDGAVQNGKNDTSDIANGDGVNGDSVNGDSLHGDIINGDNAMSDMAMSDIATGDMAMSDNANGERLDSPPVNGEATTIPDDQLVLEEGEVEDTALGDALGTPRSAVKIKGRPGGVSLELGEGEWDELIHLLEDRLKTAEGFFRGGRVFLDVGPRPVTEDKLRQVRVLLEAHQMTLAVVRSTSERTLQAAAEVGVSTSNEEPQESFQIPEAPLFVDEGPPNAYTPSPYAPPPDVTGARPNHFVYRGSLRSGQVLRKTESIVIIGDVNPGAQVISGGDIMVWGRLRGIAHAGAEGNRRSVVAAIDFVPTQLRIANLTAIAPDQHQKKKPRSSGFLFWKKELERRPEIARVIDGRIMVEPWDDTKPSGVGAWTK